MSSFDRDHQQLQSSLAWLSGADGTALLGHLRQCEECSGAFARVQDALLAALYLPPPRPMDPFRAAELRQRLLVRPHRVGRGAEQPLRGMLHAATGWTAAAGLAVLLLTHHAFHRPLGFGPVGATALAAALIGSASYVLAERRRSAALRERLAALEAELARIRSHALGTDSLPGAA